MQSGLDDIGNTYVEIDYTSQHLWYYKDGSLVTDTGIVSGNISRETAHRMASLRLHTNRKMPHLSAKNYASNVRYFMPFAYNVGIHDASWRSTFGKEIYKTSGSHGCINVPPKRQKNCFRLYRLALR